MRERDSLLSSDETSIQSEISNVRLSVCARNRISHSVVLEHLGRTSCSCNGRWLYEGTVRGSCGNSGHESIRRRQLSAALRADVECAETDQTTEHPSSRPLRRSFLSFESCANVPCHTPEGNACQRELAVPFLSSASRHPSAIISSRACS